MSGVVHQMYCTHCTKGKSALEHADSDEEDRVLGYSARAGSLDAEALLGCYQQLEPYLYYYLPSDAKQEDQLRLDYSDAPRRLVYSPIVGDLQLLLHMSYRRTDSYGRPGSYFGHALFADRGQPWDVLDCLKTWNAARWVRKDTADLPIRLEPWEDVRDCFAGRRPAIDDEVLLCFLRTPAGGEFHDDHQVIETRWRNRPADDRFAIIADCLDAFLQAFKRRENVLLVVEPATAALIFYGVARLLPKEIRKTFSFSTFEPDLQRIPTTLAATVFCDPTFRLNPDSYRHIGRLLNTFSDEVDDAPPADNPYTGLLTSGLREVVRTGNWTPIDELLEDFDEARAASADDLEVLAATHRQKLGPLLRNGSERVPINWSDRMAVNYLAAGTRRFLRRPREPNEVSAQMASPNGARILELLTAQAPDRTDENAVVDTLLEALPEDAFSEFLESEHVDSQWKVRALTRFVIAQRRFPSGCESHWRRRDDGEASPHVSISGLVFEQLDEELLLSVYELAGDRSGCLHQLSAVSGRSRNGLGALLKILRDMDDEPLLAFLKSDVGAAFRPNIPLRDGIAAPLEQRLSELLRHLWKRPRELFARVELLLQWCDQFPDPERARRQLKLQKRLRDLFEQLETLGVAREAKSWHQWLELGTIKRRDAVVKDLAAAVMSIVPSVPTMDERPPGSDQLRYLNWIGGEVLTRPLDDFLTHWLSQKVKSYFAGNEWLPDLRPASKAVKSQETGATRVRRLELTSFLIVVVLAALAAGGAVALYRYNNGNKSDGESIATNQQPASTGDPAISKGPSPGQQPMGVGASGSGAGRRLEKATGSGTGEMIASASASLESLAKSVDELDKAHQELARDAALADSKLKELTQKAAELKTVSIDGGDPELIGGQIEGVRTTLRGLQQELQDPIKRCEELIQAGNRYTAELKPLIAELRDGDKNRAKAQSLEMSLANLSAEVSAVAGNSRQLYTAAGKAADELDGPLKSARSALRYARLPVDASKAPVVRVVLPIARQLTLLGAPIHNASASGTTGGQLLLEQYQTVERAATIFFDRENAAPQNAGAQVAMNLIPLADLSFDKESLLFQWRVDPLSTEGKEYKKILAAYVLRMTSDDQVAHVAFYDRATFPELQLTLLPDTPNRLAIATAATFSVPALSSYIHPSCYRVGEGDLLLKDRRHIYFSRSAVGAVDQGFAAELGAKLVHISVRTPEKGETWQVVVEAVLKSDQEIDPQLSAQLTKCEEDLAALTRLLGGLTVEFFDKAQTGPQQRLSEVAAVIGRKPPTRPADENPDELRAYKSEVQQIIDVAKQRKQELLGENGEVSKLKAKLETARKIHQDGVREALQKKEMKLSVVLYRVVDGVTANDIVIGTPFDKKETPVDPSSPEVGK